MLDFDDYDEELEDKEPSLPLDPAWFYRDEEPKFPRDFELGPEVYDDEA